MDVVAYLWLGFAKGSLTKMPAWWAEPPRRSTSCLPKAAATAVCGQRSENTLELIKSLLKENKGEFMHPLWLAVRSRGFRFPLVALCCAYSDFWFGESGQAFASGHHLRAESLLKQPQMWTCTFFILPDN